MNIQETSLTPEDRRRLTMITIQPIKRPQRAIPSPSRALGAALARLALLGAIGFLIAFILAAFWLGY
jgi:hypothetical protein